MTTWLIRCFDGTNWYLFTVQAPSFAIAKKAIRNAIAGPNVSFDDTSTLEAEIELLQHLAAKKPDFIVKG